MDAYARDAATTLGIVEYTWELPVLVATHTPGEPAVIDAAVVSPVARGGDPEIFAKWRSAAGMFASEMEAAAIEKALGVPAVSTTRVLVAASDQLIGLVELTPDNLDAHLPILTALPPAIISILTNEVRTLKRNAIVPRA